MSSGPTRNVCELPIRMVVRMSAPVSEQDLARGRKLPGTATTGRVVERYDEVGTGSGLEPPSDGLPRREQVAQADHGVVLHQRRANGCGGGLCGRDAWHEPYGRRLAGAPAACRQDLEHRAGHAVNAGVSARDERYPMACTGKLDGPVGPLHLLADLAGD